MGNANIAFVIQLLYQLKENKQTAALRGCNAQSPVRSRGKNGEGNEA